MHAHLLRVIAALAVSGSAQAAEITVKNDSLTDFANAVIVTGFIAGGGAGSWLNSPCNGNIRAVQVFWRSQFGTSGDTIHESITIYRSGSYPTPGAVAEVIGGPVLSDGVLNEWRFIDENNVIPINVPVTDGEDFVVALRFAEAPPAPVGPSVVRDTDGIQSLRNTIYSNFGAGFEWRDSASLGVAGDWVIRAVIDCPVGPQESDVAVGLSSDPGMYIAGQPLDLTLVVDNAGPSAAPGTTVVNFVFPPAAYTGMTWTCSGSGGAVCASNGSGNISQAVDLPSGSQAVFSITGTVAAGTTGTLTSSATAVVAAGITDPLPGNNSATLDIEADSDLVFADGFEQQTPQAGPVAPPTSGHR